MCSSSNRNWGKNSSLTDSRVRSGWPGTYSWATALSNGLPSAVIGLPKLLWNLITNWDETVGGIKKWIEGIQAAANTGDVKTLIQLTLPSLYDLLFKPELPWKERGFAAGKLVGEFGSMLGGVGAGTAAALVGRCGFFNRLWGWANSRGLLSARRAAAQLRRVNLELAKFKGPGLDELIKHLQSANEGVRKGAQFQAARALEYARQGLLQRIEVTGLRNGRGVPDLLLNRSAGFLLVECKNWPAWLRMPLGARRGGVRKLEDQIRGYLEGNNRRLRLEFANMVPNEVKQMIQKLPDEIRVRVTPVAVPFLTP